jgi:hypothetical protein
MHTKWYISVLLVLSNLEGACNRVLDQMLFSPLTVLSKHTRKSFVSECTTPKRETKYLI